MTSAHETCKGLYKCPLCDSKNLTNGETAPDTLYRTIDCLGCSAHWEENFKFGMAGMLEDADSDEHQVPNAKKAPKPSGSSLRKTTLGGIPPKKAKPTKQKQEYRNDLYS